MKPRHATRFLALLGAVIICGIATAAETGPADPGWPRYYSRETSDLVVYTPQIDAWNDFKLLKGRCAFALRPTRGGEPIYGTLRFESDTLVDPDQRVVLLRNVRVFEMRFPSAPGGTSPAWDELTRRLLPSSALVVSLDRILAFLDAKTVPRAEARVLTDPPPIYVSSQPALLVILDGDPVLLDVEGSSLHRVLNTNWELYFDRRSNLYYLRNRNAWLSAPDLYGPYSPAVQIPADLARIPAPAADGDPRASSPAAAARDPQSPRVYVVTKPAELIVLAGVPEAAPIAGTQLSSVFNTESDLFYHAGAKAYFFLASGRWFRADSLQGPWQYASTTLPADFARIPAAHPRAHVLAAVPGTREAEDAVLLASIPRTAEINRKEATAEVQYVGAPQFTPIPGTSMSYAKNTPSDVIRAGNLYYLCFQGVWFVSASATGPWEAAGRVPSEIYTIPESSPKYNVTYVRIYESNPATVVVGYTPGYYGAYVAGGVVVWGTGYYYPPYVALGVAAVPVYWGASCYTYGAGARYNPATGVYARGTAVYGPYGGYGAAAAYNPRTGTYAQGAAAWGPGGGVAAGRSYNPNTGTYSAGYGASNAYGSWGQGVVGNGGNWARGGYQSTSRGAVAAGQTSAGGSGVAVQGAGGNSGYVARSGGGDVYAGANGNVYKRDDGQWYQNQNGSWNAMDKGDLSAERQQQAAARDRGNLNAQNAANWRANGGDASRAGGGGFQGGGHSPQRPGFQGRRR